MKLQDVVDDLRVAYDRDADRRDGFDAVYPLSCLLHVPNTDLPLVLGSIRQVLRPGAVLPRVVGRQRPRGPDRRGQARPSLASSRSALTHRFWSLFAGTSP